MRGRYLAAKTWLLRCFVGVALVAIGFAGGLQQAEPLLVGLGGCLLACLAYRAINRDELRLARKAYRDAPLWSGDLDFLQVALQGCPKAQARLKEAVERSGAGILTYGVLLEVDAELGAIIEREQHDAERERTQDFLAGLDVAGEGRGAADSFSEQKG